MSNSIAASSSVCPKSALKECLTLASEVSQHCHASRGFAELQNQLAADNPQAAELLELAWNEVLAARRSAAFWEQLCDVERDMTEQMAANHLRLQQNYLRLMQEQ
jgi:hypothetical protein